VPRPTTPAEALSALREGNERFVRGEMLHPSQGVDHRSELSVAQHPFAVIFGCSDSRVAAEIIFDQGLGDVFVVRTAGHVLDTTVIGSIEYGVDVLGASLVVVLGHDSCGAVAAATRESEQPKITANGYCATLSSERWSMPCEGWSISPRTKRSFPSRSADQASAGVMDRGTAPCSQVGRRRAGRVPAGGRRVPVA
jgi:carbonic anhydrase